VRKSPFLFFHLARQQQQVLGQPLLFFLLVKLLQELPHLLIFPLAKQLQQHQVLRQSLLLFLSAGKAVAGAVPAPLLPTGQAAATAVNAAPVTNGIATTAATATPLLPAGKAVTAAATAPLLPTGKAAATAPLLPTDKAAATAPLLPTGKAAATAPLLPTGKAAVPSFMRACSKPWGVNKGGRAGGLSKTLGGPRGAKGAKGTGVVQQDKVAKTGEQQPVAIDAAYDLHF